MLVWSSPTRGVHNDVQYIKVASKTLHCHCFLHPSIDDGLCRRAFTVNVKDFVDLRPCPEGVACTFFFSLCNPHTTPRRRLVKYNKKQRVDNRQCLPIGHGLRSMFLMCLLFCFPPIVNTNCDCFFGGIHLRGKLLSGKLLSGHFHISVEFTYSHLLCAHTHTHTLGQSIG